MPNSLLTGVSGLLAHQRLLDVVGHNIANMNTTGFKSQRILFADLLYETIKPASSSNDGSSGGTNPNQIGGGVKAAQTDRNFGQGSLENTGGEFDFALSGPGFFTLFDSSETTFTRAGTFSLDEQGYLVAPGGLYVERFSSAGEPDGVNPGFQVPGDQRIFIPLGASVEGIRSSNVSVTGNLKGDVASPAAQQLQMASPFTVGGVPATGTDLINSLDSIIAPYPAGETIVIDGTTTDGSTVFSSLTVNAGTTLQDLVDQMNADFPGSTATLVGGAIHVTNEETGASVLNIRLNNGFGNTPDTGLDFVDHRFEVTTEGTDPGEAISLVTVYDAQGGAHELTLKFRKQSDDVWSMQAVIDPDEGIMLDDTIDNMVFNDSGQLLSTANPTITMQLNGIALPQTLTFDFGGSGAVKGLTNFNSESTVISTGDGSPPGVLSGVQVDGGGEVKGIASNGKVFTLAQLSISSFGNTKGLTAVGDNRFQQSLNSGTPTRGTAGTGGRGMIVSGQLEASNVDVAQEFTKLIVAQTGYNANARTITVSSELLEELTNIIR